MKLRIVFFSVLFLFSVHTFSESIKFLETINLKFARKGGKIADIFFGKEKLTPIKPTSIFMIGQGTFGATDQINGNILVFKKDGIVKKRISRINKTNIVSPVSGSSDGSGGFFISDSSLRMILQFSKRYKFEKVFRSDQDRRITGIVFFKNKLFCIDTINHSVVVFDNEGVELLQFGSRGRAKGEFNFPTHIAVDGSSIYVTDALNFRIQKFDHKGKFLGMFGKNGRMGGDFSKPKGIAVDNKKRIYVADVMFDNVQVFDQEGILLSYFGGPGNESGRFWMPSGIMIDKENKIYIADTYNNRIQVFKVLSEKR